MKRFLFHDNFFKIQEQVILKLLTLNLDVGGIFSLCKPSQEEFFTVMEEKRSNFVVIGQDTKQISI
jgi:hypothetical protein